MEISLSVWCLNENKRSSRKDISIHKVLYAIIVCDVQRL